jgi:thiol:disulfide interchange protein DsbD
LRQCLWLLSGWAVVWGLATAPARADEFLAPEKAFAMTASVTGDKTLHLHWDIATGYHLYQDRIALTPMDTPPQSGNVAANWKTLQLPPAETVWDTNFNKNMAIYQRTLDLDVSFTQGSAPTQVAVGWQGCADAGLCYAPATQTLQVSLSGLGAKTPGVVWVDDSAGDGPVSAQAVQAATSIDNVAASTAPSPALPPAASSGTAATTSPTTASATDAIASTLASGSLLKTMGVFLGAGLLLAFTPCVLPMVPILSSLIAGQSGPVSRTQGFLL